MMFVDIRQKQKLETRSNTYKKYTQLSHCMHPS